MSGRGRSGEGGQDATGGHDAHWSSVGAPRGGGRGDRQLGGGRPRGDLGPAVEAHDRAGEQEQDDGGGDQRTTRPQTRQV
jgi:hypothetical protein